MSFQYQIGGSPSPLPSWATQSGPYQIKFKPVPFSLLGTHTIHVEISDTQKSSQSTFDLEVFNTEPRFTEKVPIDQTINLNNSVYYKLPPYADYEVNPITIILIPKSVHEFITIDQDKGFFTYYPTKWRHLGTWDLTIILTDTNMNSSDYKFKLKIINSAPYFNQGKPKSQLVPINQELRYSLPKFKDNENNPVKVVQTLPPFIKFDSKENMYIINATNPTLHLGNSKVKGEL